MKIENFINHRYIDPNIFTNKYISNQPFPHIIFKDFINNKLLEQIESEFPDLSKLKNIVNFTNQREIKFTSLGFGDISPSANKLISFLNSNIFLEYLNKATGISEVLVSDPYLSGGGYHEIKKGGLLKVHVDYNKHPLFNLDRRLNLLLYLNKNWQSEWGGFLELYNQDNLRKPVVSVKPEFNTCVIFTTTSYSYHGHPDILNCPENKSRKSIALYYFSSGRPFSETSGGHSTLFVQTKGEKFKIRENIISLLIELTPPLILRNLKYFFRKYIK